MNFLISSGICSPQSYQSMLHFKFLHMLSNEFLLIHTHQDLLYVLQPLFWKIYLLNKHHQIYVHFDNIFVFQN